MLLQLPRSTRWEPWQSLYRSPPQPRRFCRLGRFGRFCRPGTVPTLGHKEIFRGHGRNNRGVGGVGSWAYGHRTGHVPQRHTKRVSWRSSGQEASRAWAGMVGVERVGQGMQAHVWLKPLCRGGPQQTKRHRDRLYPCAKMEGISAICDSIQPATAHILEAFLEAPNLLS